MPTPDTVLNRRTLLGGTAAAVAVAALPGTGRASGDSPKGLDRSVEALTDELRDDLIALRRDLHAHPEGPGEERRTAGVVAARLRACGLDVTTGVGGHGVVGVLRGAHPGRTVAFRADMDAVPAPDQIPGGIAAAHLCGHDLHTTVGVGVAEVLSRLRRRLHGTVVFVFQPAEEALTGAAAMLDDGVFDRVRPEEIHALHCGPFPVGTFATTAGFGLPGRDSGAITVTGPDAAARAEELAARIAALGTVSPPDGPEGVERLVTDFVTPDGPLAEFVYLRTRVARTDTATEVQVVFRCWPEERYVTLRGDVDRIAREHGTTGAVFPEDPFPAMACPVEEGDALHRFLRGTFGRERAIRMEAAVPFSGEDYALFLDRLPGTWTFLGVRSPGAEVIDSYPHFGAFTPDENAIGHGVRAMSLWLASRAHGRG
ncbi:amidohydrolase [Stackebrandtia albiflava]|uniref:Amidohydrolase n=1 Tax=Stackebrandtia albiflava TaxID=406432 RepID=A0A562V179_9ACTN|nr:M20/M25/M40 family metallo-hydrolase [Stackebrandtia albiflava]TWJ11557.1 amidohydrolase [Stackebrandtia albiflava]